MDRRFVDFSVKGPDNQEYSLMGCIYESHISGGPGVLMIPGFKNSGGQRKFVELAEELQEHNITSFLFDPLGCGYSQGSEACISIQSLFKSAQHALDRFICAGCVDRYKICFVGHSLGALIAVRMQLSRNPLILLASAIDQRKLVHGWITPAERESYWKRKGK